MAFIVMGAGAGTGAIIGVPATIVTAFLVLGVSYAFYIDALYEYNNAITPEQRRAATFSLGLNVISLIGSNYAILRSMRPSYAPRIRQRAVEDPKGHNFPFSFDKLILRTKPKDLGGDRIGYALHGIRNNKEVVYNIIVKNGEIIHRDWVYAKNWNARSKSFGWNLKLTDIPIIRR